MSSTVKETYDLLYTMIVPLDRTKLGIHMQEKLIVNIDTSTGTDGDNLWKSILKVKDELLIMNRVPLQQFRTQTIVEVINKLRELGNDCLKLSLKRLKHFQMSVKDRQHFLLDAIKSMNGNSSDSDSDTYTDDISTYPNDYIYLEDFIYIDSVDVSDYLTKLMRVFNTDTIKGYCENLRRFFYYSSVNLNFNYQSDDAARHLAAINSTKCNSVRVSITNKRTSNAIATVTAIPTSIAGTDSSVDKSDDISVNNSVASCTDIPTDPTDAINNPKASTSNSPCVVSSSLCDEGKKVPIMDVLFDSNSNSDSDGDHDNSDDVNMSGTRSTGYSVFGDDDEDEDADPDKRPYKKSKANDDTDSDSDQHTESVAATGDQQVPDSLVHKPILRRGRQKGSESVASAVASDRTMYVPFSSFKLTEEEFIREAAELKVTLTIGASSGSSILVTDGKTEYFASVIEYHPDGKRVKIQWTTAKTCSWVWLHSSIIKVQSNRRRR